MGVPVFGTGLLFLVESTRGVDIRMGIMAGVDVVVVGRETSKSFDSVS